MQGASPPLKQAMTRVKAMILCQGLAMMLVVQQASLEEQQTLEMYA